MKYLILCKKVVRQRQPIEFQKFIAQQQSFLLCCKRENIKHFNGVEGNIYFKHKDDAHEKEFTDLLYVFNRQLPIKLEKIHDFFKILNLEEPSSIPRTPKF